MGLLDRLRPRGSESDPMQAATVMTVAQLRERNRKFIVFMQHKVQDLEAALGDYQQHESEMAPADEDDDLSWVEPDAKAAEAEPEQEDLWPEGGAALDIEATTFEAAQPDEDDDLSWARPAISTAPEGKAEAVEPSKMEDWMSLMGVTGADQTTMAVVPSDADNNLSGTTPAIEAERVHPVDEPAILENTGEGKNRSGEAMTLTPALTRPGDVVESIGFGGIQDLLIQAETDDTR